MQFKATSNLQVLSESSVLGGEGYVHVHTVITEFPEGPNLAILGH